MTTFRFIVLSFFCLFNFSILSGQNNAGIVHFERKTRWVKIMERLPFLSQEEKDRARLTWGNEEEYTQKYILEFSPKESTYKINEEADGEDDGWSWRKSDFLLRRDFVNMKQKDWIEMLGKTYLVEDDIKYPKWKILNEIKEVAGYVCMKAETRDTIKNQVIHAWFTDAIASQAGPETYGGLPGMILELDINDTDVRVIATKVELKEMHDPLTVPKKMKGKIITRDQFNKLIKDHIAESTKAKRNPYWSVRY